MDDFPRHGDRVMDLTKSQRGTGIVFKVTYLKTNGDPSLMIKWDDPQAGITRRDPSGVDILERAYRVSDGY